MLNKLQKLAAILEDLILEVLQYFLQPTLI
jgi:hypothetical protein